MIKLRRMTQSDKLKIGGLIMSVILLVIVIFNGVASNRRINLSSRASYTPPILEDNFENGLTGWEIKKSEKAVVNTSIDTSDKTRNNLLSLNYPGDNSELELTRKVPDSLLAYPNLIYEIEFWDDGKRDYGAGFYIKDADGRYIEFVVDASPTYQLRNGRKKYDTKILRSGAKDNWHKVQIFVT